MRKPELQLLLDSSHHALVIFDGEEKIIAINQAFETQFGWTRGSLLEQNSAFLFPLLSDGSSITARFRGLGSAGDDGPAPSAFHIYTGYGHLTEAHAEWIDFGFVKGGDNHFGFKLKPANSSSAPGLAFEEMLKTLPGPAFVSGSDGQVIWANRAGYHALDQGIAPLNRSSLAEGFKLLNNASTVGFNADGAHASGTPLQECTDPLTLAASPSGSLAAIALKDMNGQTRWIRFSYALMRDLPNCKPHILFIGVDITDVKQSQERLQASQNELESSAESYRAQYRFAPSIGHVVDRNGVILDVSERWLEALEYDRDEVIGRSISEFVPSEWQDYYIKHAEKLDEQPPLVTEQRELITKSGRLLEVETSTTTESSHPGHERILTVSVDVTERNQAIRKLRAANNGLEIFAAMASHDLQAPLRKVKVLLEILETAIKSDDREQIDSVIETIGDVVNRSQELVRKILELARLAGGDKLALVKCEVIDILDTVVKEVSQETGEPLDLIATDALVNVNADAGLLRQAFVNLVTNSIKYQHPDRALKITLKAASLDDGSVKIVLSDNGIGFDQKFADTLFRPFTRLHTGRQSGSGIGLAIVEQIVHSHGWSISAEGWPDRGAAFHVKLPASQILSFHPPSTDSIVGLSLSQRSRA